MNALNELRELTDLFPDAVPLFEHVEHIPASATPEPYHQLLVHDDHMTVAMEEFHQTTVDVEVLTDSFQNGLYCRKIVLYQHGTRTPVQFGLVRFDLETVNPAVRSEIISRRTPLGRVLIQHDVLRQVDLGAILKITAGPGLAAALQMPIGGVTYGRLATIFCNDRPAIDLLEVSSMLA